MQNMSPVTLEETAVITVVGGWICGVKKKKQKNQKPPYL